MAENFIKKWDGLFLEDWGSVVSPEYKKFQNAMVRELRRIAKSIGADYYAKDAKQSADIAKLVLG